MNKLKYIASLIIISSLMISCHSSSKRFKIDTNKNRIGVQIQRFDKDLINLNTNSIVTSVDSLHKKYPNFFPLYINQVLDTVPNDNISLVTMLRDFVQNDYFRNVNKKTLETFAVNSDIESEISDAYTYIHHYFPTLRLPRVYFFVSGFNLPYIVDWKRNLFGLGVDLYLGADYEPYKSMFYDYMLQNMRRERISTDVVSNVLYHHFTFDGAYNRLLENMLYNGKIMYLMSVCFPDKEMKDIIGYSQEQWFWAENNEKDVWKSVVGRKDLFSSDLLLIRKYINDAPFTANISQDSPGRLGIWLGWRIVDSYMRKNGKVTLPELMKMNNYQKMLEESDFQPN